MYVLGLSAVGLEAVPAPTDDPRVVSALVHQTHAEAVVVRLCPACRTRCVTLVRALHTDETTATVPIVAITSFTEPAVRRELGAAGATLLLLLPQTPEQLGMALNDVIQAESCL